MNVFKKLFCGHKWEPHSKSVKEWVGVRVVPTTRKWYKPRLEEHNFKETVEILICSECGKIKKLKY